MTENDTRTRSTLFGLTLAGALTLAHGALADDTTYLEVAVFNTRDPAGLQEARAAAARAAPRLMPGQLWWLRLNGEGQFADIVAWRDAASAKAAADNIANLPEFAPLMRSIDKVTHFAHYLAGAQAEVLRAQLFAAPLVEIALYSVEDARRHTDAQAQLYRHLSQRDGWLGGAPLAGGGESAVFGDLLAWRDQASWRSTGAALMQLAELEPFFAGVKQTKVFALFEPDTTQ